MSLRAMLIGCGALLLTAASAQAACHVTAHGTEREITLAQRLVRFSESGTVSGAWSAGTCTIINVLHPGGDPCPDTVVDDHVTVGVHGVHGAYHVFPVERNGGWCTTH